MDFVNDLLDQKATMMARKEAREQSDKGKLTITGEMGTVMRLKLDGRVRKGTCLLLLEGGKKDGSKKA